MNDDEELEAMSDAPQCADCARLNVETHGGRCWTCDRAAEYARGVADERARVVADLVKSADRTSDDKMGPVKIVLLNAAIRFERCEHEEKP